MDDGAPTVIIAVGDELLGGFTLDTNSHWLAGQLRAVGRPVRRIEVVGDHIAAISASIQGAVADTSVTRLIVCGGMGPTPDDRTVEAVASALGRPLVINAEAVARLRAMVQRMHAAGWVPDSELSEPNLRMARLPEGAVMLENRRGMASPAAIALAGPEEDRWLFVLPGVTRELQAITTEEMIPRYFGGGSADTVIELRYVGIPESLFATAMETVEREYPGVSVGSYPQTATRDLVIRIRGQAADSVAAATSRMQALAPDSRP